LQGKNINLLLMTEKDIDLLESVYGMDFLKNTKNIK